MNPKRGTKTAQHGEHCDIQATYRRGDTAMTMVRQHNMMYCSPVYANAKEKMRERISGKHISQRGLANGKISSKVH